MCKRESRKCYCVLIDRTESFLVSSTNKFWDFVRKNRSASAVPKNVTLKNLSSTNEQEVVVLLTFHFSFDYSNTSSDPDMQTLNLLFLICLTTHGFPPMMLFQNCLPCMVLILLNLTVYRETSFFSLGMLLTFLCSYFSGAPLMKVFS